MNIIKGEIVRVLESDSFVTVRFSVDELCKNYRPYINFWTFCLVNDLIMKWDGEDGDGKYYPKISYVDLTLSEDEEKNKKVIEMLKKYDISIY